MKFIGRTKIQSIFFCLFIGAISLGVFAADATPEKPASPSKTADDTAATDESKNDPNAVEIEPVADPNEMVDTEESVDVFSPKLFTLVEINEAYETIFSPEFVTDDGRVRYADLRRKRSTLLTVSKNLANLNPAVLMTLSKEEKIAFWINTYNASILKLIVDNYPIEHKLYMIFYPNNSIMQITGDWRSKHFFEIQTLQYTLQEIEQDFLVGRSHDPRIFFALSYASMGGAMLRNEPYTAEKLDEQLDEQIRKYLSSPAGLEIDQNKNIVYLSNLFSMYKHKELFLTSEYSTVKRFRDRKPDEQAWLNFIWDYLPEDDKKYLKSADFEIKFIKYDWLLNEAQ